MKEPNKQVACIISPQFFTQPNTQTAMAVACKLLLDQGAEFDACSAEVHVLNFV